MAVKQVVDIKNDKVADIELNDRLFGVKVKMHILHDIVRMQLANRRAGTSCTKSRSEVRGSSAKPWRQKGTGRARSGSRRSPLWRGGGVVFGPKPRDYSYSLPKKVRKLGLRMALSARNQEEQLVIVNDFNLGEIKTKKFTEVMRTFNIENALIITPERNEQLEKSSRNVPGYKVLPASAINVYDILHHQHLILLEPCIGQLEERLLS